MAIERPGGRTSSEIMSEGMGMETGDGVEAEAAAVEEFVTIPPSQLGGQTVAPGDVIRLEAVEVDDATGAVKARYAKPAEETETEEELTIENAAAAFD